MAIWNGKRFVDALPLTRAADARGAGKTKDCGCADKPTTRQHTQDALPLDNRGFWRITKSSK